MGVATSNFLRREGQDSPAKGSPETLSRRTKLDWPRCSLLVDAEGADVMPSRPNEHSSLGAPVRGCYHHLKRRLAHMPHWPAAA